MKKISRFWRFKKGKYVTLFQKIHYKVEAEVAFEFLHTTL